MSICERWWFNWLYFLSKPPPTVKEDLSYEENETHQLIPIKLISSKNFVVSVGVVFLYTVLSYCYNHRKMVWNILYRNCFVFRRSFRFYRVFGSIVYPLAVVSCVTMYFCFNVVLNIHVSSLHPQLSVVRPKNS